MSQDLFTTNPPFVVQYSNGDSRLAAHLFAMSGDLINIVPPFFYNARRNSSCILMLEGPARIAGKGHWQLPDGVAITTLEQMAPSHPAHQEWQEWLDYLDEAGPEKEEALFQVTIESARKYDAIINDDDIKRNRRVHT